MVGPDAAPPTDYKKEWIVRAKEVEYARKALELVACMIEHGMFECAEKAARASAEALS